MTDAFDSAVADLRAKIDGIDSDITALVRQRTQVSREIQELRMARGGVRIDLAREREIVTFYGSRLGTAGIRLATSILLHCRGQLAADRGSREFPDSTDERSAIL